MSLYLAQTKIIFDNTHHRPNLLVLLALLQFLPKTLVLLRFGRPRKYILKYQTIYVLCSILHCLTNSMQLSLTTKFEEEELLTMFFNPRTVCEPTAKRQKKKSQDTSTFTPPELIITIRSWTWGTHSKSI